MKNAIAGLSVAVVSFAFTGVSFAQAKPASPTTPAAPAVEQKTETKSEQAQATILTGEVRSVDAKAGTLTVKLKDKEVNLIAESKGAKAALEKVKVGDEVRVFEKGGKVIAVGPVKAESKTKTAK